MNAQHTLRIEGVVIVDDGQCDDKARPHVVVRNSNEEWVALCEDEEQAAFIVRACNAHDGLVAACLRVVRSTHFSIDRESNRSPEALDIRYQLEAALAKAGAL